MAIDASAVSSLLHRGRRLRAPGPRVNCCARRTCRQFAKVSSLRTLPPNSRRFAGADCVLCERDCWSYLKDTACRLTLERKEFLYCILWRLRARSVHCSSFLFRRQGLWRISSHFDLFPRTAAEASFLLFFTCLASALGSPALCFAYVAGLARRQRRAPRDVRVCVDAQGRGRARGAGSPLRQPL
eukprot:6175193-Pleurochrysis_carterae.AAC.7